MNAYLEKRRKSLEKEHWQDYFIKKISIMILYFFMSVCWHFLVSCQICLSD